MKKSLLILPLIVVSLAGCDPATTDSSTDYGELISVEVVSGLEKEYIRYTVVDLDEVSATATFANGSLTIEGSDLTFNPETIDTTELGEFELTISYQTTSVVWTYAVIEYATIDNLDPPQFVIDYDSNIKIKGNKQTEFMDREQGFYVGDENPFKFFPTIYAYDEDDLEVNVTAYHSVSVIEERSGTEWVRLTGTDLDAVVAIDNFASTYDFTSAAVGKEYRLTVRPYGEKYATDEKYEQSFEFKVGHGYNVYSQDDLSHYDNYNSLWDTYRTENEITKVDVSGLFFQNDIKIERDKLPDGFFYMENDVSSGDADYQNVVGSLRDDVGIYHRDVAIDESFVFNGNYFNLDYSSLPYVVRVGEAKEELGEIISHASLFRAGIRETRDFVGDLSMKNISVVGNSNRSEEPEKTGGCMFLKTHSVNLNVYNSIVTQCYTTFITEHYTPKVVIEKMRGYDSFSSMLYNWGTNDFLVKDSELIGSGGPVIITDHVGGDKVTGEGGNQPHTVVENSTLRAFVTGNEYWFRLVYATPAVTKINELGAGLLYYGTNSIAIPSYGSVNLPHFSIVGLIKAGDIESLSTDKVNGSFTIDDGAALDFSILSSYAGLNSSWTRLQSSGGQSAIVYNDQYLVNSSMNPVPTIDISGANYFTGDYMNLYFNAGSGDGYMGIVFELLDTTVAY